MDLNNSEHFLPIRLGFSSAADVEREGKSLRIPTRFGVDGSGGASETRWCQATDLQGRLAHNPGLLNAGFDQIDLSGHTRLQQVLAEVREAGFLNEANVRRIRSEIQGRRFRLSDGRRLKVLFLAPEGLLMRRSGPNRVDPAPNEAMTEYNGHKAADQVHSDQNVYGTPLKQMLKGAAPWLFRHQTLGRRNRFSPVFLLNLWIPLQQNIQPLALADRRSVDCAKQQIRYALPTDGFLEREDDQALNDVWLFLHDDKQQWYCDTSMNSERAYVFDTLGAPHGAATLPGEDVAESYFKVLTALLAAAERGESETPYLDSRLPAIPEATPAPLRAILQAANELLTVSASAKSEWLERVRSVRQSLIRQSLEMRLVAFVY